MGYPKPRANRAVYDEHWRKWKEKFGAKRNRTLPKPQQPTSKSDFDTKELDDLTDDESEDIETSA